MIRSPERRAILVAVALVVEGLLSVRIGFAPFEQRQALLALMTGWFVGGCGLLAWLQVPSSRTGLLLVSAGAAWFIGGFRWLDLAALAVIADTLSFAYAGVTAHAILTFPTGRATERRLIAAVVAAYASSLVPPPAGPVLVACALVVGLALIPRRSVFERAPRRPALYIGVLFAIVSVAGQVLPFAVTGASRFDFRIIDQVGLMLVAAGLAATLLRASERRARVTDLVVDLDPARGGLARELARAIGDPTLEVGYWLPEQRRYVDATGHAVAPPGGDDDRGATFIEHDGAPVAMLVHEPTVTTDPAIRAATTRAVELSTVNARLQAETRAQMAAVAASRRRLLRVADDERRDLDTRLRDGVEPTLDDLEAEIDSAIAEVRDGDGTLTRALEQLAATRLDLAAIIEDLHPRILDERGLRGAIEALAARSPIPASIVWDGDEPTDPDVGTALFFVCSEGLANIAKHAGATRVRLQLTVSKTAAILEIEDDGRGGAGVGTGTGLEGLRDRLQAVGGSLTVSSPPDGGTRLIATLPVEPET